LKRHLFHLALLSALLGSATTAFTQAKYTATRRINLQAGGSFVLNAPDYSPQKFWYGYGAYTTLDFTDHLGVEFDYHYAHDIKQTIGGGGTIPEFERTFAGGLRYYRTYNRFYPYVKGTYGIGTLQYPPYPPPASQLIPAAKLNYPFVGFGGGTDYALTQHISLRLEVEDQHWFAKTVPAGTQSPNNIGGLPDGLTPLFFSVGASYVFGPGNYYGPH
jgi:opacity protein-like surface antigen